MQAECFFGDLYGKHLVGKAICMSHDVIWAGLTKSLHSAHIVSCVGQNMVDVELPSAKRAKLSDGADEAAIHGRPRVSAKAPRKCADLVVNRLEDFYKPNPPFRLPAEIGCFSFDSQGKLVLDRSGLKAFSPPAKIGVDLKVGFSDTPSNKENAPDLTPILTWISHNLQCFQPGLKSSKSFDGSQSLEKGGSASASSISPGDSASTTVSNGAPTR